MSLAASVFIVVPTVQSRDARPATTLEHPFAAGGQIRMDLSAGEYELSGTSESRIRIDSSVRDENRLRDIRNHIDVRGKTARVTTEGPSNNFHVAIYVPGRTDLVIRLTAGELAIKGIEGNKDVELHAGELDIDVDRPEDYHHVDAAVWAGEIDAAPYRIAKGGLFRSFDWKGSGPYRLHAHLKAGEVRLHATSAVR
jgi:hypothetical protein